MLGAEGGHMLTYNNSQELKDRVVADAVNHAENDRYDQSVQLHITGEDSWVGGALGCTVMSWAVADGQAVEDAIQNLSNPTDTTDRFVEITHLPLWFADAAQAVFEHLPPSEAPRWPAKVFKAVPVGVDITPARDTWIDALLAHESSNTNQVLLQDAQAERDAAGVALLVCRDDLAWRMAADQLISAISEEFH